MNLMLIVQGTLLIAVFGGVLMLARHALKSAPRPAAERIAPQAVPPTLQPATGMTLPTRSGLRQVPRI